MNLYIDEDLGKAVPQSLRSVRPPDTRFEFPRNSTYAKWPLGTPDRDWLPWAGDAGYTVISQNYHILRNPDEFQLIVDHGVRIIFVGGAEGGAWEVLRVILNRWEWIRAVDTDSKPSAWYLPLRGRPQPYDLGRGPDPNYRPTRRVAAWTRRV